MCWNRLTTGCTNLRPTCIKSSPTLGLKLGFPLAVGWNVSTSTFNKPVVVLANDHFVLAGEDELTVFLRFKSLNGSRSWVIHEKDKPFQALEEAANSFVLVWIPNLVA